jgi:hypothetical protein
MNAADDVAEHIRGSLMDLRRRLDAETAIEIARAVLSGATRALQDLSDDPSDHEPPLLKPIDTAWLGLAKH